MGQPLSTLINLVDGSIILDYLFSNLCSPPIVAGVIGWQVVQLFYEINIGRFLHLNAESVKLSAIL
jgi:hypothetical protein